MSRTSVYLLQSILGMPLVVAALFNTDNIAQISALTPLLKAYSNI